jgi:peptidoglycan/LPS O-acetylase OafA/YrhL
MPTLDGVRGVAILWVVIHNFSVVDVPLTDNLSGHAFAFVQASGWAAVTLFFALSGFLITGILLDSRNEENYYRNFYVRRTLRIFPLYYGVLFVAFVVLPVIGMVPVHVAEEQHHQIWLWTYTSNWVLPFGNADKAFPHFWSLAVEEQFYLLWPFIVHRRSARFVLQLCLGLAVAALVIRLGMLAFGAPAEALYTFSVTRMDAIALGGGAAAALRIPVLRAWLLAHWRSMLALSGAVFLSCLVLLHGLPRTGARSQTVGYGLLAIAFSLLVVSLACADLVHDRSLMSRLWRVRPLRVLARYSYGMYVFHVLLSEAIGKPFMRAQSAEVLNSYLAHMAYLCTGVLMSLLCAMASYHLFEQKFLRFKPRFAGRGTVPLRST